MLAQRRPCHATRERWSGTDAERRDRTGAGHDGHMFLGEDLLAWLVLAFGAALCVGNLLAVVRPPERPTQEGDLARAPIARSVVMGVIGFLAALWALASLVSG
jgi:hypothetical protein